MMKEYKFGVRKPRVAKLTKGFAKRGGVKMGHPEYTAPHNRAKAGTTTPRGAPGAKKGTTTPKLGAQMSVHDLLASKFPGSRS